LDNLWVLSKLKHKEVLKLIKAPEYWFQIRDAYTFTENKQITREAAQNLKLTWWKDFNNKQTTNCHLATKTMSSHKNLICSTQQQRLLEQCGKENTPLDSYLKCKMSPLQQQKDPKKTCTSRMLEATI
jgi:hypothetical protein